MAREVPQMVSGLSMALRLLSSLYKGIEERRGHPEILHHLTTERGSENLGRLIEFILSLEWRFPKSMIMELARKASLAQNSADYSASDMHFFWGDVVKQLRIPVVEFHADPEWHEPGDHDVKELRDQLHGREAQAGMVVTWNGAPHVVVHFTKDFGDPKPGDIIDFDQVGDVFLAPAHYIDLES